MKPTQLKEQGYLLAVSVCLSAGLLNSYEWILMKYIGGVGRGPRNSHLDFGGYPDHDPSRYGNLFKSILYYCDAYRQPRIKT